MKNSIRLLILKLLLKLKILKYINISCKVNNIRIPIIGGLGFTNIQGTEKWMTEIIRLLIEKSTGSFLDVGVNIGQTLIKLKSVNINYEYIGFEPNPSCAFYSDKLIQINKFPNSKIIPSGVSNVTEIVNLSFFDEDITDSSASIVNDFRPTHSVITKKKIIVLNGEIIKLESKITVLKIDVEGAELMVIEGLIEIIKTDRPYILVEILPVYNLENKERLYRQNELLKIMNNLNYSVFRILKNQNDSLNGVAEISDIPVHSDLTKCDYLLVPEEKKEVMGSLCVV